jgi:hypothetical protein
MMSSIEIDALYVKRSVEVITTGGTDDTYASKVVQIPVIFRVNLIPSILSVGAGPYYEIGLSSGVDDTFGGTTANYSYTALNMKHMDYGLVGSARFQLPLFPFVRMLVDARYVYGLSEQYLDTSLGESLKNRYIQVFAGLGLSM